jgi:hypothetical protein
MVLMGFLNKFFGFKNKQHSSERKKLRIKIEEIDFFLKKNSEPILKDFEKQIFSFFSRIKFSLNQLSNLANTIEEKKISIDEGNQRLRKIVLTSKKNLALQLNSLAKKFLPPSSFELEKIKNYCVFSPKLFESEIMFFRKNIAYSGILLKEEVKLAGEKAMEVKKELDALKQFYQGFTSFHLIENAKEKISLLKSLLNEKEELINSIDSLEKQFFSLKNQLSRLNSELYSLKNSSEMNELNALLTKKNSLLKEKQALNSNFLEIFSKIEKPLKRFTKLVKAGNYIISNEEKELLLLYESKPLNAFKRDQKGIVLKKILSEVKEKILDGTISLKEKEKEKKISAINFVLKFDFFENFFWKLNSIESNLLMTEKKISSFSIFKKIVLLEQNIESIQKELNSLNKNISMGKKNKTLINEKIEELSKKISLSLSNAFNSEIILELN